MRARRLALAWANVALAWVVVGLAWAMIWFSVGQVTRAHRAREVRQAACAAALQAVPRSATVLPEDRCLALAVARAGPGAQP